MSRRSATQLGLMILAFIAPATAANPVMDALQERRREAWRKVSAGEFDEAAAMMGAFHDEHEGTFEGELALVDAENYASRKPDNLAERRRWLRVYLRRYPRGGYTLQQADQLVSTYAIEDGPDAALPILTELEELSLEHASLARATCRVAYFYSHAEQLGRAMDLYRASLRRWPEGPAGAEALFGIADLYHRQGYEDRRIEAWWAVTRLEPVSWAELFRRGDHRSQAYYRLATHYMEQEQWQEALQCWGAYHPSAPCGNGASAMDAERACRIATCYERLGRIDEAIETLESWRGISPSVAMAMQLTRLAMQHGKLDDLLVRLEARQQGRYIDGVAAYVMVYAPVAKLAEQGDLQGLWSRLGPYDLGHRDVWLSKEIVRLLAGVGDAAKPLALEHARTEPPNGGWGLELLAVMKADELVPLVEAMIKQPEPVGYGRSGRLFRLLALSGTPAARAALGRVVADEPHQAGGIKHIVDEVERLRPFDAYD